MNKAFTELVKMARRKPRSFAEVPREDCVAAAQEYARHRREEIRKRHDNGESGWNVVVLLTEVADVLLRGVFEFALYTVADKRRLLQRISLCAQGGYGRGQLNPYSDLDIGLLYEHKLDQDVEALNNYLVPFLWDIGYGNSYVVRSVDEALELAKKDVRVFTSYLECRHLYGSRAPFARLRLAVRDLRPGDTASSFADIELRARSDFLPAESRDLYAVEPNLKDGAGGLRDYHAALWLLTVAFGVSTIDEAVGRDLISSEEGLELAEALDLIWRIRNELHFHAGKREDRLTYANQLAVAEALGYTGDGQQDITRFMEDYYGAARKLRRFLRTAARAGRLAGASKLLDTPRAEVAGLTVEDGELYAGLNDARWFEENPSRLMVLFWECARRGVILSHPTERLVRDNLHLVGDPFRSSNLVRRFFLDLCNRPCEAGAALRQAAHAGLLELYLPEFGAVKGTIRYQDFHRYPVDEHTLRAVEALAQVPELEGRVGKELKGALARLSDPYILVLALLFHDLGKVSGEKHTEEGVRLARVICRRIGLTADDEERIAFLVQHHMLMSHIGIYRDTDDPDIVESFAKTMKSDDRLRALFLLTFADMAAVGPNVWNDWKGSLLLRLYLRTERLLSGRTDPVSEEFWTLPKAQQVRDSLPDELKGEMVPHLKAFGDRYFSAFSPEYMAIHIACLREAGETGLALRCIRNDDTETSDVVICTEDRNGLFAEIAGCFASQLIDVRSAALFTGPNGITLDCFSVVNAARHRPLTKAQFAALERVLKKVLLEHKDVGKYLEQSRRRLFALLQSPVPIQTRISFDNGASRTHTVVDIESGDRTGLLYDITRALSACGLAIASARIVTDARRVRDSFYIALNNSKIEDKELQAETREAIKSAVHPQPAAETQGGTP